ncbi:MAG TPA: nuclear transport factor 2 family protein [Caulobacteraceae bacterium]
MTPKAPPHSLRAATALLALAALASAAPALARAPRTTAANLLDRVQIEDFLVDYYQPLGGGKQEDLASFFTDDGVIDVNGRVYSGHAGITQAYKDAGAANKGNPTFTGKFLMLMNNPRVEIHGDTATADVVWTGIVSTTPKASPHLAEQGKEHDDLVKVKGEWMIKKRIITSTGGLAPFFQVTYIDR